jgi:hypothetical protein
MNQRINQNKVTMKGELSNHRTFGPVVFLISQMTKSLYNGVGQSTIQIKLGRKKKRNHSFEKI